MKKHIEELLIQSLLHLKRDGIVPRDTEIQPQLERTRSVEHGDYASNMAMVLAKAAGRAPRELAQDIIDRLPPSRQVAETEIAGPGFINFTLSPAAFHTELRTILANGEAYGRHAPKTAPRILLEFVSANPTGPLHVGHGRHASYGATVGNLLEAVGYPVHREYYVNDAGRQMDILGVSVWLRWLEMKGTTVPFPAAGYRGEYIRDIAAAIDTDGIDAVAICTPNFLNRPVAEAFMAILLADALFQWNSFSSRPASRPGTGPLLRWPASSCPAPSP